jgi:2-polyprenyl-3-methyl-5-hydroxy-6-metoxy-1,4-benzoquinol methylase
MGWGKWALMAKAFGSDTYGSELSKSRIQFAKSNGVNVISWDEISLQQFDFINTEQVFEHISDPLGTLCWLKNALKPNGLLKIGVPSRQDIKRRLRVMDWKSPKGTRDSLNPVAPLEHINCFTRLSLLTMAKKAGMQEIFIPMKTLYAYTVGWGQIKKFPENVLLPIWRNVFKKPNYILLCSI